MSAILGRGGLAFLVVALAVAASAEARASDPPDKARRPKRRDP
jgi:hypothetical protein